MGTAEGRALGSSKVAQKALRYCPPRQADCPADEQRGRGAD